EEALAEGDKIVAETEAETQKLVATIDRQIAEIEAEATVLLGEAEASSKQLLEEAKADKFVLAVDAFGSGAAYNQWVFATGLPVEIDLQTIYAGEGTFWTDLKGMTETLLGKQVNDKKSTSGSKSGR
ncbi:band 7 protein, partial [Planctomycetaceae bacterium]|nr:band 7 protein [Planctomycetaceae bacterium]